MLGRERKEAEGRESMTEADWLDCTDPTSMLEFLRGKASERTMRLFAVACCRRIWPWLPKPGRKAVTIAEGHAEGLRSLEELQQAHRRVSGGRRSPDNLAERALRVAAWATASGPDAAERAAHDAAEFVAHRAVAESGRPIVWARKACGEARERERRQQVRTQQAYRDGSWTERAWQTAVLRCLAGNLVCPTAMEPRWLDWGGGLVVAMGRAIREGKTFEQLPILADALEEAGCSEQAILDHCRGAGPHVRGCWCLSLILGKE
jgi:hypothetical protein